MQVVVADVHTVDPNRAFIDVVEPGHELDESGLARAGLAREADRLARFDRQSDVVDDHFVVALVAECHAIEDDTSVDVVGVDSALRALHGGLETQ